MQVDGALQEGSVRPRRRRLNVLLTVVVIVAMIALLVWAGDLAGSGAGAENASPNAGARSAPIHDDPWNLNSK